jgi:EAL domain-containing protein (putative c-di-GMP-specific phosphodiesterase class I)
MRAQGIGGSAIGIEFTESLLMNAGDRITNCLLDFRDNGMQMVIDDFGTGYSSLSNLKHFDIGSIKIDRSFVRNLEQDKNDRDLCEAIIVMAHKLGIEVIAEGVETRFQDQVLRDFGCDYAQGYLYSRPVPAIDLTALIASRT